MNPVSPLTPLRAASLLLACSVVACTSVDPLSGDKVDYRSAAPKSQSLEVPPDLTQLARDGRYQTQSGVVSANTLRQGSAGPAGARPAGATATAAAAVAPSAIGDLRIERQGTSRWLVTPLSPEQLYPQVRSFWTDRGFVLTTDDPKIGLIETDWAENRAKLPEDFVRRTIGRVFDGLYSTSERDRYRTRIERTATGSEVYITQKGMQEVYSDGRKDQTQWVPRPNDPELEAEFLSRLMVKLGAKEEVATAAVAAASAVLPPAAARAPGLPATATMELNESFDRAWRLVGLALDRSGFTVEDRDRGAGLYFVRYIDPKLAGKEDPNFFSKMFSGDKEVRPQRMRVVVKADVAKTRVSIQAADGTIDNSEQARTIIGKLMAELK